MYRSVSNTNVKKVNAVLTLCSREKCQPSDDNDLVLSYSYLITMM
jgi:hypothetical protein